MAAFTRSPEGCAAILWKDGSKAELAAKTLKINVEELIRLGIIDDIVSEPVGAAHRDPQAIFKNLKTALVSTLKALSSKPADALVRERYAKFRGMGVFTGTKGP